MPIKQVKLPTYRSTHGFTLVEVLVAMAILAVSLAAASRVSGMAIAHSVQIKQRILADMVAQNQLALHLARDEWLPTGLRNGVSSQAGINFKWKEEVTPTPNPAFMKIVVTVNDPDNEKHVLRKLTGFLVKPNP